MTQDATMRMSGAERTSDADRQAVWAALNAEVVRTFLAAVERGGAPIYVEAPAPTAELDECDCAECRW